MAGLLCTEQPALWLAKCHSKLIGMVLAAQRHDPSGRLTPLVDDLLDGVVALLVGVGAHALEGVGARSIRAPIAHIDEGTLRGVDSGHASNGAQVCVGDWVGQGSIQHLLGCLHTAVFVGECRESLSGMREASPGPETCTQACRRIQIEQKAGQTLLSCLCAAATSCDT